jgi:hypothetical protein
VQGFLDDVVAAPLSLKVHPYLREPDYRRHERPIQLTGTVTAERLSVGSRYSIYRWDSVQEAFTYTAEYKITTFTAANSTFVYKDGTSFSNNGTTYYRCVEEPGAQEGSNVVSAL